MNDMGEDSGTGRPEDSGESVWCDWNSNNEENNKGEVKEVMETELLVPLTSQGLWHLLRRKWGAISRLHTEEGSEMICINKKKVKWNSFVMKKTEGETKVKARKPAQKLFLFFLASFLSFFF